MKIEERKQGAVLIIRPDGPLSGADTKAVRQCIDAAVLSHAGRFVLDASSIPFIDSGGLELLVDVGERVASAGRSFKISGLNETVREVFELTEVADLFEYFETPGAAARSFA